MMFFLRIWFMAARSLRANLMRSLLACLGVVVGVAAVVGAMSILEGSSRSMLQRLETLGADQVFVSNGSSSSRGSRSFARLSLTVDDADALGELPVVKAAAAQITGTGQIKYFENNRNVQILATGYKFAEMYDYNPADGRFLDPEDIRGARKNCVLGWKVAQELYGDTPAVDTRVRLDGVGYRVVGVMESKGFLGSSDVDTQVIIPVTTGLNRHFGSRYVQMITVQAYDASRLEAVTQEVKRTLRREHNIRAGSEDDFQIFTREQFTKSLGDIMKIFAIVLGSIAGISLVVGGIGIMNIMLVSVTERTREIGVRIAVGAQRGDILTQFLIESSVISILGGALGILLGYEFTQILHNMMPILETYTSATSISWALSMAIITGIISGIYPALRASRLDPVEALRYE